MSKPTRALKVRNLVGIRTKLYFYLGFSLALVAYACYFGYEALSDTLAHEHRMERETTPRTLLAAQLAHRTAALIAAGRTVAEAPADAAQGPARALAEVRRLLKTTLGRAHDIWDDSERPARVAAGADALNNWVDAMGRAPTRDAAELAALETELIAATDAMTRDAFAEARRMRKHTREGLEQSILWFLALVGIGFVTVAFSVWLFVHRVLLKRLAVLSSGMRRMAGGDLEAPVVVPGADELSDMGYALDIFREYAVKIRRMDEVERLSSALREKNAALETALANLERAQDQVVHQEKLAALGQLTAGVAHEIKNPLNFIQNFSIASLQLFEDMREIDAEAEPDETEIAEIRADIEANLKRVIEHSARADTIVKSMLLHAKTSPGLREATDIAALLTEFSNLAYHSQRAHDPSFQLEIKLDLSPQTGTVPGVAQDLGRVVLNLVTNACQATAARSALGEEGYVGQLRLSSERTDDSVIIRVRDNGCGLSQTARERMFEPFFTTKAGTEGTGLGLSLSHDIVRAHGGAIEVDSVEGEFAEFAVRLPLREPTD